MSSQQGHPNDFDFFIGSWQGRSRRLRERLKGSNDWEELEVRAKVRKILGGLGNIDEVSMEREAGHLEGVTLRLFNPKSGQWSLHWVDGISGVLQTPLVGGFKDEEGEFYAQEIFEDKSIFNRFICSEITETSCRWEQAFSEDGGKTWETNWIVDFKRI